MPNKPALRHRTATYLATDTYAPSIYVKNCNKTFKWQPQICISTYKRRDTSIPDFTFNLHFKAQAKLAASDNSHLQPQQDFALRIPSFDCKSPAINKSSA